MLLLLLLHPFHFTLIKFSWSLREVGINCCFTSHDDFQTLPGMYVCRTEREREWGTISLSLSLFLVLSSEQSWGALKWMSSYILVGKHNIVCHLFASDLELQSRRSFWTLVKRVVVANWLKCLAVLGQSLGKETSHSVQPLWLVWLR